MKSKNEHKKLIWANRMSFLLAGFCIAAWAPMIPFVKENFALDEHNLGLLLLCVGLGSLIAIPTSGFFTAKFGCKLPIYLATVGGALSLSFIPLINNIYLLGVLLLFFGFCAVIIDVVSNINSALIEKYTALNIMSGLHGLYSVGGFLGSMSVTFLLSRQFELSTTGIYAACFLIIILFLGCRHLFPTVHLHQIDFKDTEKNNSPQLTQIKQAELTTTEDQNLSHCPSETNSIMHYYFHPLVLAVGIMCFIMFMTEGSMLDWSGVFLHFERGIALEHAGYGYAAFAIMMTICRLIGDKIVSTFGPRKVIIVGTLSIVFGFSLAVWIPHYISAFVGFAFIGVGASNVVPQLVSFIAKIDDVPMHISITIVNAIGFSGMLCGPALIGFLAHAISLPYTYLVQALMVLLVLLMTIKLIR